MAMSYVLINADVGKENEIITQLKGMKEVKEVHFVYGVYDIIAKVETSDVKKLKEVVITKIRKLDCVKSTLTMIVMEP